MVYETEDESLRRMIREKNDALRVARNAIENLRGALRRKTQDAFDDAAMQQGLIALTRIEKELP